MYRTFKNLFYVAEVQKLFFFSAMFLSLDFLMRFPANLSALTTFTIYVITGGWKFLWIIWNTATRDIWALMVVVRVRVRIWRLLRDKKTVPKVFYDTVLKHPDKIAFICEDRQWTYSEVDRASNRVANYFLEQGYQSGDTIALFMESRPEMVMMWLGLSKVGVIPALINLSLKEDSLAHCVNISHSTGFIFSPSLTPAVVTILDKVGNIKVYCHGDLKIKNIVNLERGLASSSPDPPTYKPQVALKDKLFYIYTSGTTGLPKAAIISHFRFMYMSAGVGMVYSINPKRDILYTPLPLYHVNGGIIGVGTCLLWGVTQVVRPKFSASSFWNDCIKHNVTVAQYIGEICRYLLCQPPKPQDTQHRLRLVMGNGLRSEIWEEFRLRFNLKQIGEFYGATEGNANVLNMRNKIGSVGFCSRIIPWVYPVKLVKVDESSGKLIRDRRGMAVECLPGEPGMFVGKIVKKDPVRQFDGYIDKKATSDKVAYDVFTPGDQAFLTGDILTMDEFGNFFFKDRTGDTYRWKGENVSSCEIESIISNLADLRDCVVFGVHIPGTEGRAGMAAILDEDNSMDIDKLSKSLDSQLPGYAKPAFIKLVSYVPTTGTHKLMKVNFRNQGYTIDDSNDKIFMLDVSCNKYIPFTQLLYQQLKDRQIRF